VEKYRIEVKGLVEFVKTKKQRELEML